MRRIIKIEDTLVLIVLFKKEKKPIFNQKLLIIINKFLMFGKTLQKTIKTNLSNK